MDDVMPAHLISLYRCFLGGKSNIESNFKEGVVPKSTFTLTKSCHHTVNYDVLEEARVAPVRIAPCHGSGFFEDAAPCVHLFSPEKETFEQRIFIPSLKLT